MKTTSFLTGITLCLALSGCATPYQQHDGSLFSRGGFYDKQVAEDKFEVGFYGNQFTSFDTGGEYYVKRCQEVCREKGFRDFIVIDRKIAPPYYKAPNFFIFSGLIQCLK